MKRNESSGYLTLTPSLFFLGKMACLVDMGVPVESAAKSMVLRYPTKCEALLREIGEKTNVDSWIAAIQVEMGKR